MLTKACMPTVSSHHHPMSPPRSSQRLVLNMHMTSNLSSSKLSLQSAYMCVHVRVCVCVWERYRKKETEAETENQRQRKTERQRDRDMHAHMCAPTQKQLNVTVLLHRLLSYLFKTQTAFTKPQQSPQPSSYRISCKWTQLFKWVLRIWTRSPALM